MTHLVVKIIRETPKQSIVDIFKVEGGQRIKITEDVIAMSGGHYKKSRKGDGIVFWDHAVRSHMKYIVLLMYGGSPFDGPDAREAFPYTVEK